MPTYSDLPPHVREVVDRTAAIEAKRLGIPVEQAREFIAARVHTASYKPTQGTGH